jgi:hypothetical protein
LHYQEITGIWLCCADVAAANRSVAEDEDSQESTAIQCKSNTIPNQVILLKLADHVAEYTLLEFYDSWSGNGKLAIQGFVIYAS